MAKQLQMVWPEGPSQIPGLDVPDGYEIRQLREGDEEGHIRVMHEAGFTSWDKAQLKDWWCNRALPDGVFVVEHKETGQIVASAMACHRPSERHPWGGELGWVAGSPDHAGRALGRAVCVAVLRRFRQAGYRRIYLSTDDFRLPALKTYLKLGFVPFLFASDMEGRWQAACEQLKWPCDPSSWARAPEGQWVQEPEEDS